MKVAVTGKGGSGKTAVAALLGTSLRRRGYQVLYADLDTNPGLELSLGLPPEDTPLPDEVVEQRPDRSYGWGLAAGLAPEEVVRRHARVAPNGGVLLGFGSIGRAAHPLARYLSAVREVVDRFDAPGWAVVMDLEAGPATPFEGFTRAADVVLVLVEATPASVLSARRILSIVRHDGNRAAVVAAQVRAPQDRAWVAAQLPDAPLVGSVPHDQRLAWAERRGSLADLPDDAPAARAVDDLATWLTGERVGEVAG